MQMCIFFLCCHSSADMTFGFIHINNLAGFCRKCRIHLAQPIRVYPCERSILKSVMFGSLPHSCLMFNDIVCDFHGSFFNISFKKYPCIPVFVQFMQGYVCLLLIGFCLFSYFPGKYNNCLLVFPVLRSLP